MCVLQTSTHLTDIHVLWLLVCALFAGIYGLHVCLQTISHIPKIKASVAHERSWPTGRLNYASHRDCCYCTTWFRYTLAICMMLEVKINPDPS